MPPLACLTHLLATAALLLQLSWTGEGIELGDVPTFTFACFATNSAEQPAPALSIAELKALVANPARPTIAVPAPGSVCGAVHPRLHVYRRRLLRWVNGRDSATVRAKSLSVRVRAGWSWGPAREVVRPIHMAGQ